MKQEHLRKTIVFSSSTLQTFNTAANCDIKEYEGAKLLMHILKISVAQPLESLIQKLCLLYLTSQIIGMSSEYIASLLKFSKLTEDF